MILTILGKRWRFLWRKPRPMDGHELCGACDDPTTVNKAIWVDPELEEQLKLDTVIHEIMHAAFWWLKEEWVNQLGTDIARALWRLGYRRVGR